MLSPFPGIRRVAFASMALATVSLVGVFTPSARCDDLRETTSLKIVPENVAFYATMLRNREQYDRFVNSKAFAKLKNLPLVQFGWGMLQLQWENSQEPQVQALRDFLSQEENKGLLDFLADAASAEIFLYGDASFASLAELVNRLNSMNRAAQIEQATTGRNPQEILAQKVLEALANEGTNLKVPTLVVGMKIEDKERAQHQIERLEKLLQEQAEQQPKLKDRISRETVGGSSYLTLRLDGAQIPWEEVPLDRLGDQREAAEKLIAQIKKSTITFSLGVRDGYLLFSIGEGNQQLADLGKGKLLVERPELASVVKAQKEPITSISYVSQEFAAQANAAERQFDDVANMAKGLIPLADIEEGLKTELSNDVQKLVNKLKTFLPQPGATVSFAFMTDAGFEGFSYNWTKNPLVDSSKALSILEHVGGEPLAVVAGRSKPSPEAYEVLVAVVKRAIYYAEQIGGAKLEGEDREKAIKLRDGLLPLLSRLDTTTRESLMPALKDGQSALVLDAKAMSRQWQKDLPQANQPLPMFEPALIVGVSDEALLKKAGKEYFAILQEALKVLHEVDPNEIPEIQLPPPDTRAIDDGTAYVYQPPVTAGLDEQIAPNAAVSAEVAVISLFPQQSERLLKKLPLKAYGAELLTESRPVAGAAYFNFAGMVDVLSPWIKYGFAQAAAANAGQGGGNPLLGGVEVSVRDLLTVLKCYRSTAAVTYLEGDVLVTRFESQFEDLE